jgi:hypothetical protein
MAPVMRQVVHKGRDLPEGLEEVVHRSSPLWGQRDCEMSVGLVGRDYAPRGRQSRDCDLIRAVRSAT